MGPGGQERTKDPSPAPPHLHPPPRGTPPPRGRDRPVVFDDLMAAPVVLRHKDVSAALRNGAVFSPAFYGTPPMETMMIAHNGPEHMRQRRIHNRFFNP